MVRSAEQERADRLAARARKKRGTAGKKKSDQKWLGGASLVQVASQNQFRAQRREESEARITKTEQEHKEFLRKTEESIKTTVARCRNDLPRLGSFFVERSTTGFEDIVRILQADFFNTEFRWHFSDRGFALARKIAQEN